jgi:hypothetical protein
VVVIHHPAKNGSAYRGSSVFKGNVDWMIGIEVSGGRHEIVRHKMRDLEWDNPLAFEIAKHGSSIVAVGCNEPSPLFMVGSEPGLRDALMDHGLHFPGRDYRPAVGRPGFVDGVTIRDILDTWKETAPIEAGGRDEKMGESRRRRYVLIGLVNQLIETGAIVSSQKVSTRDYSAVLKQPAL